VEHNVFAKILVCSDGSEHAIRAAETAVEIALKFGSQVTIINVLTHVMEPALLALDAGPASWESAEEAYEAAHQDVENRTGTIFEKAGIRYDVIRERGHAVDRIVDVAEKENAELIVLGSRGLGTFTRMIMGSVSDGVLHHAHCPVLVVR
jgi:nucleotide-binding universal stress UspA family protein